MINSWLCLFNWRNLFLRGRSLENLYGRNSSSIFVCLPAAERNTVQTPACLLFICCVRSFTYFCRVNIKPLSRFSIFISLRPSVRPSLPCSPSGWFYMLQRFLEVVWQHQQRTDVKVNVHHGCPSVAARISMYIPLLSSLVTSTTQMSPCTYLPSNSSMNQWWNISYLEHSRRHVYEWMLR